MMKNMCIHYYFYLMKKRTDVLFIMSVRLHKDVRSYEVKRTDVSSCYIFIIKKLQSFLSEHWNRQEVCSGKILFQIVLDIRLRIFLNGSVLHRWIEVVEHRIEGDSPALDGLETQQGMVDAAQLARSDKDERITLLRYVVDGEKVLGKGDHQTAGSFHQYPVVAASQFEGGTFNLVEINGAPVDACGQVGRAGIGIDFGHGQTFPVFGQVSRAHDAAVEVDVLAMADVARLDELLGDDPVAFVGKFLGQPGCTIAFPGICIDATDKINVVRIHKDLF